MPRIYSLLKIAFEGGYFEPTNYRLIIASADFMIFKPYIEEMERYLNLLINVGVITKDRTNFFMDDNRLPVLEGPRKDVEVKVLGYIRNRSYSMRKWRNITSQNIRNISKKVKALEDAENLGDKKAVIVVPTQKVEESLRNYRDDNKLLFPKSKYEIYHYGNKLNGRNFQEDNNLGLIVCFGDYVPNLESSFKGCTTARSWGFGIRKNIAPQTKKEIWSRVLINTIQALKRGRGLIPTYYIGNLLNSKFEDDLMIKKEIFDESGLSIIYIGES